MAYLHPENIKTFFEKDRLVLCLFVMGSVFIEGSTSYRMVGLLMILSFLILFSRNPEGGRWFSTDHPPEINAFTLWIIWVFLTMPLVSRHPHLMRLRYQVMIQVVIMYWVFYGCMRMKATPRLVFATVLIASIIQAYLSLTGYVQIIDESQFGSPDMSRMRVEGIGRATNSNALGTLMVRGVLCALFFWRTPDGKIRLTRKIFLLVCIGIASYVVVISGSRKSSIYLLFVLAGWSFWALPGKQGVKSVLKMLIMLVLGYLFLNIVVPRVMQGSALDRRWTKLTSVGDGTIMGTLEEDPRLHFLRLGMDIWKENPVFGVGLGHFRLFNPTGQVSHSDYIETLTGTGIVGFVLYQSMKVFLLLRLMRLKKRVRTPYEMYLVQIMILMAWYIVLSGIGFHQYNDYQTIVFFATLFTYTWCWERKLSRSPAFSYAPSPSHPPSTRRPLPAGYGPTFS